MSAFRQKAEAQRKYIQLTNTIGYKPANVNLRRMNATQINAAYKELAKNVDSIKSKNVREVAYPSRATMWKLAKENGKTSNLQYKNATSEQLYNIVKGFTNQFKPRRIQKKTIANPVNGKPLNTKGFNLFKKVGYVLEDNVLVAPTNRQVLKSVKGHFDEDIYPIEKNELKVYRSGIVFYSITYTNGTTGDVISEGFRITKRMSATIKINEIIYSYNTVEGVEKVNIVKVEMYKPAMGPNYHGIAYRMDFDDFDGFDDDEAKEVKKVKNCVISALESVLRKDLSDLHKEYANGVAEDDYLIIAKKLKIILRVDVCGEKRMYNALSKRTIIDLIYLNNHCIANFSKEDDQPIVKYDVLDRSTIDKIFDDESIYDITNIIKVGQSVIGIETLGSRYQLSKQVIDGHDIAIVGNMMTATSEYKVAFTKINKIMPTNFKDAKNYCRHGIKILKSNFKEGYTVDLRAAYNNFMKWDCYDGMPMDITFDVNHSDEHLETILANYAGFGLVSWKNYFLDTDETRWATIPHIKSRLAKGHKIVFHKWNLAFRKGDLDMSMFNGTYKRLWQYVVGSLSRTQSFESKATTDPILANSLGLTYFGKIKDAEVYFGPTKEREEMRYYTHISAYVQSYTEIMMEDKFDQMKGNWWGIYVDGISTNLDFEDLEDHIDEFWDVKRNKAFTSFDSVIDMSYTAITEWKEGNEFCDIGVYGSDCYKIIDGPAGSGKSTLFKKIQKMTGATVLVQNNPQREIYMELEIPCMSVDMYLTQRLSGEKVMDRFVLIDEYFQMDAEKLCKFNMALLAGNKDQLPVSKNLIHYADHDHHLLTKVYRCNPKLNAVAKKVLRTGDYTDIDVVEVKDALLNNRTILAATHKLIERINDVGLSLDIPRKIRFTKTDLKKDIWANDMGVYKNGVCINNRNGLEYKIKPMRLKDFECRGKCEKECVCKPLVVYGYARTYHSTQGQEYNDIVCCVDGIRDWKTLYTGITRIHSLDEVNICSLDKPEKRCIKGFKGCGTVGNHEHVQHMVLVGKQLVDAKWWFGKADTIGPDCQMACGHFRCRYEVPHTHEDDCVIIGRTKISNWTY